MLCQRETKRVFWERVEGEGRREEAEKVQAELLASGLNRRVVQEKLVALSTAGWVRRSPENAGFIGKRAGYTNPP